jgi:hypothetical protein
MGATPARSDRILGNAVSTHPHTCRNTLDRQVDIWKRNENQTGAVTPDLRGEDDVDKLVGAEDSLDSDTLASCDGFPDGFFGTLHGNQVGATLSKIEAPLSSFLFGSPREIIRIHGRLTKQRIGLCRRPSKRRLPGAIYPADYDEGRTSWRVRLRSYLPADRFRAGSPTTT